MTLLSPQDYDIVIEAMDYWIDHLIDDFAEDEEHTERIRQANSLFQWIKLQRTKFTV